MEVVIHRRWSQRPGLFDAVRELFTYGPGEDRAAGYLYSDGEQDWPASFAPAGTELLADLEALLDVRFSIALFQAYRNGAGCDWHDDSAFDAQAILSLGATRTFGLRRPGEVVWTTPVDDGDLVFMPPGFQTEWQHCVPVEDVPGERCSLVFRTVARN